MGQARTAKADAKEITSALADAIKTAAEKHHLHKKVFRQMVALDRMEPEELRHYLDTFDHYLDISGLQGRAEAVQPMNFEGEKGGEDEDGEASDRPKGTVAAFPKPTSVAAE
jgi:uncharacterized membrane protein